MNRIASTIALLGLGSVSSFALDVTFDFLAADLWTGSSAIVGNGEGKVGRLVISDTYEGEVLNAMVAVTLTNLSPESSTQFLSEVNLNVGNPYPDGTGSDFEAPVKRVDWDENSINDAGLKFDVETSLFTDSHKRLRPGQSATWFLIGEGLTPLDFLALSEGNGSEFGLLHVQGVAGGASSKVTASAVPEPATLGVLASAALALLRRRRRG